MPVTSTSLICLQVPHPCVDKYSGENEERIYHKYYQWVYFVLFFQSACFYAPHFFWKACESKLLSKLAGNFKDPICRIEEQGGNLNLVVKYLVRNRKLHQNYFYRFILCEVFNFINVIAQIYVVNEFLGGTFTTYGLDVFNYVKMDQDERADPMARVFPKMTKCSFHRFGSSGDVQKYDALCILPLNIINEKIYIVMWFWFVFLALVTALWLAFRVATLTKSEVRFKVLKRRASLTAEKKLRYVLGKVDTGDWFVLSMMCKNMDSQWFRLLIDKLNKELVKIPDDQQVGARKTKSQRMNNSIRNFQGLDTGKERMLDNSDTESVLNDELDLEPIEATNDKNSVSNKQLDSMA